MFAHTAFLRDDESPCRELQHRRFDDLGDHGCLSGVLWSEPGLVEDGLDAGSEDLALLLCECTQPAWPRDLPLWLRYRTHAAVSFLCFELGQTTHVLAGLVLVTEKLADEEQSLKQRLVADI